MQRVRGYCVYHQETDTFQVYAQLVSSSIAPDIDTCSDTQDTLDIQEAHGGNTAHSLLTSEDVNQGSGFVEEHTPSLRCESRGGIAARDFSGTPPLDHEEPIQEEHLAATTR